MEYWLDFKNTEQWKSIRIPSTKLPFGPDKVRKVVLELDPANAKRYKRNSSGTWCNIFVTDVSDAMGYPPSHWMGFDGNPSKDGTGMEMRANRLVRWFQQHGERFGWKAADKKTAMEWAAKGHLVIVGWDSRTTEEPGHVAVLLPEGTIAQAGRRNFVGETIAAGFGNLPVQFFVQTQGEPAEHGDHSE